MIGVADYVPSGYGDQPNRAWIALLLIAEPYQRQGYGTEAYRLIEEAVFSDPDVRTLGLGVLVNNGPALGFWRAMGYERVAAPSKIETDAMWSCCKSSEVEATMESNENLLDELVVFFKALADENRLKIVGLLAQRHFRRNNWRPSWT